MKLSILLSAPRLDRLGFLGLLHMEVFSQRLEQEYGAEVIITVPSVPYKGTTIIKAISRGSSF
jgi:translation elongation factor EF-4